MSPASAACPYCGEAQSPPPQRRRKCRDSGRLIYVRTDRRTGKRRLFTESQAEDIQRRETEALDRNEGVTLSAVELRTLYEFAKDALHRAHSDVMTLMEQLENVELTRSSAERAEGAGTRGPDADERGVHRG